MSYTSCAMLYALWLRATIQSYNLNVPVIVSIDHRVLVRPVDPRRSSIGFHLSPITIHYLHKVRKYYCRGGFYDNRHPQGNTGVMSSGHGKLNSFTGS